MLEPLVALINEAISGRRAAGLVTSKEFHQRVLSHPGFDPEGLLLAVGDDGQLLGAVHAILPSLNIPEYTNLAGRGYIFGPYVLAKARGIELGYALLAESERFLSSECERIYIHGLRAPFYHAREGPRQPYCGSTEIIGLTDEDLALLDFLYKAGYQPSEEQEISMVALLGSIKPHDQVPNGFRLVSTTPENPWGGPVLWVEGIKNGYGYERYNPIAEYRSLAIVKEDTLMGHCLWFPMRRPGRVALWDLRLDSELRGHGLGQLLLDNSLSSMAEAGYREVELHTSPQRNNIAYRMYKQRGFKTVVNWIIMEKSI